MATIYIQVRGETEEDDPVVMHKHGDPMHLLTDARRELRNMGADNILHIHLCLHGHGCPDDE